MGLWRRAPRDAKPIPWLDATFEDAVARIEQLSRDSGGVGAREPEYPPDAIDHRDAELGVRLPPDLRSFYRWWHRELWLDLVNPERTRWGDYVGEVWDAKGQRIEGDHPHNTVVDPFNVVEPGALTLIEHPWPDVVAFMPWDPSIEAGILGTEWRSMRALQFGASQFGDALLCLLEPIAQNPAGSILMTTEDDVCVIVCAHSIGEWLAKLAYCGGFEAAEAPGNVSSMPRAMRDLVIRDFRRLNPGSTWFK